MGIPDGQGARHITGNSGEESKNRKKRKEKPGDQKTKGEKERNKKVQRRVTREQRRREKERERERERGEEEKRIWQPNRVLLRLRFANNRDGVLYLETVSRRYDSPVHYIRSTE